MADNAQIIWNYFKSKGFTDCGVAGLMGNLYAESGLIPTNLQNSFQNKLGMTDSQYTSAVDNGTYNNFIRDKAGYGLAQWTYWSRKQNLLQFCQSRNKSIGDLNTQLDFLYQELTTGYSSLIQTLMTTDSVLNASNAVLLQFERPANQGASVQQKRTSYGQQYYDRFVAKGGNIMTNSPLATYKRITSNKTTLSNKTFNRISIHCFVGQVTARSGVDYFATTNAECSANYVIGFDGSIGLSVEEKDRSWCTSSANNDKQAITIEVASDKTEPYKVTDEAYKALINLIVDICQRNGKTKTIWIPNKEKALEILKGYLGTLPWLAAMVGFPWSAYGVSQAFYYNKSKAENTSGGIVYETTVQTTSSAAPPPIEPVSAPINYVPNIDGGI